MPGDLDDEAIAVLDARFVEMYESRYGSAALLPEAKQEIVSVRVQASSRTGVRATSRSVESTNGAQARNGTRLTHFTRGEDGVETPVYRGTALKAGEVLTGPAVVDLPTTGIVVPPGARLERDEGGDFILTFGG